MQASGEARRYTMTSGTRLGRVASTGLNHSLYRVTSMSSRYSLSLSEDTKTLRSVKTLLSKMRTLFGLFITPSLC